MSPAVLHSLLFGTASAMTGVMTFAKADPFKRIHLKGRRQRGSYHLYCLKRDVFLICIR